jgi:hypothetical protein
MSTSYSCLASSIARLKPIGSMIIRKRSIPPRRRQHVEIAKAEHPSEDRLGQDRVVDLLERAVGRPLVDHTLHLDDAAVGQDELGVEVAQGAPREEGETADEECGGQEAQEIPGDTRDVLAQDHDQKRGDDRRDRDTGTPQQDEPVLADAMGDPFTRG